MKGISTVIATILMLMMTIALAGMAYMYISGIFTSRTGTIVEVDETATYCSGSPLTAYIYVRNIGTISFDRNKMKIGKEGYAQIDCGTAGILVAAGNTSILCPNTLLAANGITSGFNTIIVSGPSNVRRVTVYCP